MPRPTLGAIHAQRCFDAAVFGSGRPTLVIGEKPPSDMTDHVMIAWNGSLEASRAVFGAMPLLRVANRVSIFAAPQYDIEDVDPADLAEYLSGHGTQAHPPGSNDEQATGAAMVSAASEQQATLIVMGAYTHSRLRQSFLGGVTRHLLAHAPALLWMSH